MSNEKSTEYTMFHSQDGSFKVQGDAEGAREYKGSYKREGGADIVTLSDGAPQPVSKPNSRLSDALQRANGVVESDGSGRVKVLGTQTFSPANLSDGFNVLNQVTDLAGRVERDLSKVRANPENYKARIGGTEASIASLLHAGILQIDGDGSFGQSEEVTMHYLNPRDPSNPMNQRPAPEPEVLDFKEPTKIMMDELAKSVGLDPSDLYAKALGNDKSAAKQLADALGNGTEPEEVQDLLQGVAQAHLIRVGTAIEKSAKLKPGEGMAVINHAANNMSQGTGRRMMHGLLMGHIDTIQEVLAAYRAKDRY